MTEHYYWWWNGVKRLSRAEIRKMKENMQKTPLVQEKANKYHRLEKSDLVYLEPVLHSNIHLSALGSLQKHSL